MYLQGKGFVKGQKTFHPRISVKTLENRLICSKNRKFHPKTRSRGISAEKFTGETSNLLISLDLMSPRVRIKGICKIHSPEGGTNPWRHKLIYLFLGTKSISSPILTVFSLFWTHCPTAISFALLGPCAETAATNTRCRRCGGL